MQKFYQRLKENQKERARCAFLVLYFGVLAVLLFLARPLLDTTAADREWSIHFLFPCLLACIILTTVSAGLLQSRTRNQNRAMWDGNSRF